MDNSIIAILFDQDTIGRVAAAADRLGYPMVLSRAAGPGAMEVARTGDARLLVMEVDAPGMGWDACRALRAGSALPILAIGAGIGVEYTVAALRAGADYYLSRPVEAPLLEACMEALLRRRPPGPGTPPAITVRGLTVDLVQKAVRLRGEQVPVTPGEYRLLACLATQLGKVVSSADLLRSMSGQECPEQEAQEIVKVHVSRLRSKIDRIPDEPSFILNVRGFGYMLERRSRTQPSELQPVAGGPGPRGRPAEGYP